MACGFPTLAELPNSSKDTVSRTLCHFVFEIRRCDGKEYPPGSIHGIMCGIMRYFRDDCNRPDLNFFKEENDFHFLRRCIDRRMKELTEKGVGLIKKQADPLEENHEAKLWSSSTFSLTDSIGLLSALNFYISKSFGLRSRDEHRNLTINQLHFGFRGQVRAVLGEDSQKSSRRSSSIQYPSEGCEAL